MYISNHYYLVLASKSPRRQQLLSGMDFDFQVLTRETDESFPLELAVEDVAAYLCEKKAFSFDIKELPENFLLITADTTVLVGDTILNKADNPDDAAKMIRMLSGKWHRVITAICLRSATNKKVFSECTEVKFKKLCQEEINWYIEHYKPFDKAGAYGIQEWIGYIGVKSISGSFYNIMGLPIQKLYGELKKL